MTKPESDPLEALRAIKEDPQSWGLHAALNAAIAAWEKERAVVKEYREDAARLINLGNEQIASLRAAVERIEGEMRARCLPLDGVTIHKIGCACAWADSLRAAREPNRPQEGE